MNRTVRYLVVAFALATAACGDSEESELEAQLQSLGSCDAAVDHIRDLAIGRMNDAIAAQYQAYLDGDYCDRGGYDDGDYGDASDDGAVDPSPDGDGPSTGTGTNNQVEGVDEADFVKNDGQYIYLAHGGVFRIVDAWPANETHQVSSTELPGTPKKLFVEGDRALVYVGGPARDVDSYGPTECTYGYDCEFTGDGSATKLLVFDISNRAAPVLLRTLETTGSLIAGRRIGTTIHTVVTQANDPFPTPRTRPDRALCGYVEDGFETPPLSYQMIASKAFEQLRQENLRELEAIAIDLTVPSVSDTSNGGAVYDSCSSIYASQLADGAAFTSIISLDMAQDAPPAIATVVSRPGAIYASADALYMAVGHQWHTSDVSTVHKFRISTTPSDTTYVASGHVPGRALNQFAMDEYEGHLRIATTIGRVPDPETESVMSVLATDGEELVTVGRVEHIAPTEDIRSVRFVGDRAFVVTFKKTDPLYAFDLSDPSEPHITGELKIPGFSTYMHLLDDTHLLTVGYDADDHGDFAYFDGVLLQIFDIANPAAPALAYKHVIGTRGSSSEALTNHLAFTYYREQSLLSIPMTVCEGGDDDLYGAEMSFSGLMLFDATAETGFTEAGRVTHEPSANISCGNWWTDASSVVRRSMFLDEFVYSISDRELKVRSVDAIETPVADITFE